MRFIRELFFKNKPYKIAEALECGFLNVGDGHTIYYETAGNPQGVPVVILHGGPGVGMSKNKRRYYNPREYYMIHFDQRGCGKSTPNLETENNNTTALIGDMEKLRKELGVEKWVVAGGSWGTTLALAYSLMHKDRVLGLVLNGIFTATKPEIDTVYSPKGVAAQTFPEQFAKFIEPLTKTEARSPLKSYIKRIEKAGGIEKQYLLRTFLRWEWLLCVMEPNFKYIDSQVESEEFDTSIAALEMHYFKNDHFLDAKEMFDSLNYLSGIPTYIINGRFDMLCNPVHAYNLHQQIQGSKLVFSFDGHSIQSKAGHKVITGFANELLEKIKAEKNV